MALKEMKVKLLRTIENGCGDIFRKNSILTAKKRHGGYELTKKQRRKNNNQNLKL